MPIEYFNGSEKKDSVFYFRNLRIIHYEFDLIYHMSSSDFYGKLAIGCES